MMNKNLITTLIIFSFTASAQAMPFAKGDAEAGKKSLALHQCNSCHMKMLGGDGSAMYTRADHKVKTSASLATQIRRCSTNLGLMMFEEEEENLGAYLNKSYYKFK